jgi:ABC-type lipoprotein export system ATPase subunit
MKHPLKSITRYGAYKTRLVDMLGDSMRGLVLESLGYLVNIFEFVPSAETPKNIMLKAEKGSPNEKRIGTAIREYEHLQEVFHINPRLLDYLKESLAFKNGIQLQNYAEFRQNLLN